ncbi:MAG TPA: LysM peptidoglycan-binding domain-containing protein [Candidatus Cryptobacteroides intestinipullorum]|nr:LysM peptidoglycan-binding domain-containing protein [Candidatus Cryptobacteroides intestinipullorum]
MKQLLYISLALAMALGTCGELYGQGYPPVPVTISSEKVKVNGNLYYSHIVQERQTLYSISKAYNVTIDQIYEANPSVKTEGLKKNAILLIPCTEQKRAVIRESQPARKADRKAESQEYIIHTAKWYEDLDTIAEKYGVTVESIQQANGLTGRKLTRRQKLKIPVGVTVQAADTAETAEETTAKADTVIAVPETSAVPEKIRAVLMMPFASQSETPKTGSIDFYCGALMAARQAGENGTDIDISVYDTDGGVLPITREKLYESDIVIGPVSPAELTGVLEKCPEKTKIISPLDHKAEYLASSHMNFIQAPTSNLILYEDLAKWIKEETKDTAERVIVIYEKGSRDIQELSVMNTILQKDGIRFSSFSYSILEGRDIQEPLMSMMNIEAANRVLVMSESEAFVNDVVRNLNLLIHSEYEVILYGPSKIRSFDTIEVDNLHNTRLHTSLAYYVDYENEEVKDFIRKYRALYNTEPTPYAFQGYDIAAYFIKLYSEHGASWEKYLESENCKMLQADFDFMKARENGGFVNSGVRRIVYGPDYSISLMED